MNPQSQLQDHLHYFDSHNVILGQLYISLKAYREMEMGNRGRYKRMSAGMSLKGVKEIFLADKNLRNAN